MKITTPYLLKLFKQLGPDTTVITPNRRLSADLHTNYHHFQMEQQKKHWPTPDILPVSTWTQRSWDEYVSKQFTEAPLLLTGIQEQFLWENILLASKESKPLLQITETANIAKSAWHLLKQWRVDLSESYFKNSEDYAAFYEWASQFYQQCESKNWIDIARLPDMVADKITTGDIIPVNHIILMGFNEEPPQLQHLLMVCAEKGAKITRIEILREKINCQRIKLTNEEDEILTLARWAKRTHQYHPGARIGCVVPSLDKIRDSVLQIFFEVFAKENTYNVDMKVLPFNISAGKNLLHYPIIHTAIQLLSLHNKSVSINTLASLLASPFLGDAENERIKRASFDSLLRKHNINSINLADHLVLNAEHPQISLSASCPKLAKRFINFFACINENQGARPYAAWGKHFNQLLTILGWPGERSLNSNEYQIVENWLNIFEEHAKLDQLSPSVNFTQALQTLQKILSTSPFQAKTPEAPIQILGLLEAAALPFDFLWIAGIDDLSWPPKAKPNPLIPKRLQRELKMPHATSERELIYCRQMTELFKHSAPQVIFSHAEKIEEMELQASAIIRDLPEINMDDLQLEHYQTPSERIFQTQQIQILQDELGPPLQSNEKIRGGVNLIQQQALCPFKAFAEWRLHARDLECPVPGLRPKDRGNLIHKAIELVWRHLKDQAALLALEDDELDRVINHCISEAFNMLPFAHSTSTAYMTLEKSRLQKLITEWLATEKARPPFKVLMSEKTSTMILNNLTLSVRIDRIDELADGKKLIIDYKSGKNNDINHWLSERPEEPQLPLYALLDKEAVGIAFAQIFPGENYFKGISQYTLDIKGIKLIADMNKANAVTWAEQLVEWQHTLTKLSDDFCLGIAKVDPKKIPETCTWCALKPLCRIHEEANG